MINEGSAIVAAQGVLGFMFVTTVRLVWYSKSNEGFNVSVPFMHVVDVGLRESKFGTALVVKTSGLSGCVRHSLSLHTRVLVLTSYRASIDP